MNIPSVFLSYTFLGIALICLIFFLYFKILVIKTSPNSKSKDNIIGSMKDPDTWRYKNNKMGYLSLFWTLLSGALFIYLKFYAGEQLISSVYLFVYIALIIFSSLFFGAKSRKKAT